jgi:hypothetical protein
MFFLSGFTNSAILVLIGMILLVVSVLSAILIGILHLLKQVAFYNSWFKKVLLILVCILLTYLLLYWHYAVTGKGLL